MGLTSKLFQGDTRLEACLISDPAHLYGGVTGDFVRKVQSALAATDGAVIDAGEISRQFYGPSTGRAVLAYKKNPKRRILNYKGQFDEIVGQKTIAALDAEMFAKERGVPPPPPPPPPKSTDPKTVADQVKGEPIRWLVSAVEQLEGFQGRLKLGAPDFLGLDKLPREVLKVHFHIDSPESEPVKLNRIVTNYKEMLKVISTQSASVFKSATDEEARAANRGVVPHAWTNNRNFPDGAIHFTSVFVSDLPPCQQAVMVHETMHFVEPEPGPGLPDIGEGDPRYDDVNLLPPGKTIHNPSSYAAGAYHLANGTRKRDFCR